MKKRWASNILRIIVIFCVLLISSCTLFESSLLGGTWNVSFNSYPNTIWELSADGTFMDISYYYGYSGDWVVRGSAFKLWYNYDPDTVYEGTVSDNRSYISGTINYNGVATGTWHANRAGF